MHSAFRVAVVASTILGASAQAAPACFSKSELEAAQLRALQQQFNVAALNCRTLDPADPTFASHYNEFVQRFGAELVKNSEVLKRHFGKDSRGLDHWITLLANDAGSQVINRPDFCQVAWDRLDSMITLEPAAIVAYAAATGAAGGLATACPEKVQVAAKKKTPSK